MTRRFMSWSCSVRDTSLMRVLIVEDEIRMADVIKRSLIREGLAVDLAGDGDRAMWMATAVD